MIAMYFSKDSDEDSEMVIGGFNKDRMGVNKCYWEPMAQRTSAWSIRQKKIYYGDVEIASEREVMLNTSEPHIVMSRGWFEDEGSGVHGDREVHEGNIGVRSG
eukprot:TRINITY_DN8458_c0_g2_i3.p5 TRINITY_DN8458_c0_g2~~TRINITY_DN8458_c0_g2_i3.p5  ORF type:complete len:103 (+),score=20.53 TRINITY_DN8458_c0_g2_i3:722-1030(+)